MELYTISFLKIYGFINSIIDSDYAMQIAMQKMSIVTECQEKHKVINLVHVFIVITLLIIILVFKRI